MGDNRDIKGEKDMFSDISRFIEKLRFKKSIYGVNQADAYASMKELDRMYQKVFEEYRQDIETKMTEKEREFKSREAKVEDIVRKAARIQQGKIETEKRIQELEERLERETAYQQEYREKAELLADTLADTQKSKEELLEKTKRTARSIIYEAEQEAKRIVEEGTIDVEKAVERNRVVMEDIERVKAYAAENLKYIHSDLMVMDEEVTELKKKIEQVPVYIDDGGVVSQGRRRNPDIIEIKRNEKYDAPK